MGFGNGHITETDIIMRILGAFRTPARELNPGDQDNYSVSFSSLAPRRMVDLPNFAVI